MTHEQYQYRFKPEAPAEEIEGTLLLALLATESLHGTQVRLDAAYEWSADGRTCTIAADTPVGRDLCKLFAGFLEREYGSDMFQVERVPNGHGCKQTLVEAGA